MLLLASTSVYRRELLKRLGIPFECRAPGIVETPRQGERARELVARLAEAKASAVACRDPDAWVIGSDQVAVLDDGAAFDTILGKPESAERCVEQLLQCAGRTLAFVTAVSVLRHRDASATRFTDTTRVIFRTLDRATVERYVASESPLDCAGGFKSEGLGIALCRSIEGIDPTALIGLPLIRLSAVLRDAGFEIP
jgi:septum formation protein